MLTEHTVLLRAETFDGAPGAVIVPVGAEFDRDCGQRFKGVTQEQVLTFGIYSRSLHALGIPGVTNFEARMGLIDMAIAGAANDLIAGSFTYGEGKPARGVVLCERRVDVSPDFVWRGNAGVPQLPEAPIRGRRAERIGVGMVQRFELHR